VDRVADEPGPVAQAMLDVLERRRQDIIDKAKHPFGPPIHRVYDPDALDTTSRIKEPDE
jgi:hypothetical protein